MTVIDEYLKKIEPSKRKELERIRVPYNKPISENLLKKIIDCKLEQLKLQV